MPSVILRPGANGDVIELSQYPASGYNYDKVDEETPDEDATYVYVAATVVGLRRDLYQLPDVSLPENAIIDYVKVYIRVKPQYPDYTAVSNARIKTYGVEYSSGFSSSDGYQTFSAVWDKNPYTNQPWTQDEVNALQAGVGLFRSYFYDPETGYFYYCQTRCTQVYVEVGYHIPPPPAVKITYTDGLVCIA